MVSTQLLEAHSKDGWWPYFAGREQSLEATVWCSIACRANPNLAKQAISYLVQAQLSDGGWATTPSAGQSDWSSSLALIALNILSTQGYGLSDTSALERCQNRALSYLVDHRAETYTDLSRFLLFMWNGPGYDYAHGWPWNPDTYHWVQPTAYAMLAMHLGPARNQRRVVEMLSRAEDYLIKNACWGGGWNYGCPEVLGAKPEATPVDTAVALLAMQKRANETTVKDAVAFLQRDVERNSLLSEAWSIIALDALGHDVSERTRLLRDRIEANGSGANLATTALATIAADIATKQNPLKFAV